MDSTGFIIFELGGDKFALAMDSVERALACEGVRFDSDSLRVTGKEVPLLDGRQRFDLTESEEAGSLLLITTANGLLGLRVEHLCGVQSFKASDRVEVSDVFVTKQDPAIGGFFHDKTSDRLIIQVEPNGLQQQPAQPELAQAA
jgi:chemotaxis signal transduction protein